jgi:hypothetical protein
MKKLQDLTDDQVLDLYRILLLQCHPNRYNILLEKTYKSFFIERVPNFLRPEAGLPARGFKINIHENKPIEQFRKTYFEIADHELPYSDYNVSLGTNSLKRFPITFKMGLYLINLDKNLYEERNKI